MKEEDKKLKNALNENLDRFLEQMPTDEEIRKRHTFTESFQLYMRNLIRGQGPGKKRMKSKKNWYAIIKAAAMLACVIGVGTLAFTILQPAGSGSEKSVRSSQDQTAASAVENFEYKSEDSVSGVAGDDMAETPMQEEGIISIDGADKETQAEAGEGTSSDNAGEIWNSREFLWTALETGFDGTDYYVTFSLTNTSDESISFSNIYEWTYTSGEVKNTYRDMTNLTESTLLPGETIEQTFQNLSIYGVKEPGGTLIVKRFLGQDEISISFVLEK